MFFALPVTWRLLPAPFSLPPKPPIPPTPPCINCMALVAKNSPFVNFVKPAVALANPSFIAPIELSANAAPIAPPDIEAPRASTDLPIEAALCLPL